MILYQLGVLPISPLTFGPGRLWNLKLCFLTLTDQSNYETNKKVQLYFYICSRTRKNPCSIYSVFISSVPYNSNISFVSEWISKILISMSSSELVVTKKHHLSLLILL